MADRVTVRFKEQWGIYNAGEMASFPAEKARELTIQRERDGKSIAVRVPTPPPAAPPGQAPGAKAPVEPEEKAPAGPTADKMEGGQHRRGPRLTKG